jgi:hypothetical protein
MDSSDLRLIIGLLFGTFLAIVLLSDVIKRRAKRPKIKEEKTLKPTGFRRTATPESSSDRGFRRTATPEPPPDGGFRRTPAAPEGPRSPRHDFKVPRN